MIGRTFTLAGARHGRRARPGSAARPARRRGRPRRTIRTERQRPRLVRLRAHPRPRRAVSRARTEPAGRAALAGRQRPRTGRIAAISIRTSPSSPTTSCWRSARDETPAGRSSTRLVPASGRWRRPPTTRRPRTSDEPSTRWCRRATATRPGAATSCSPSARRGPAAATPARDVSTYLEAAALARQLGLGDRLAERGDRLCRNHRLPLQRPPRRDARRPPRRSHRRPPARRLGDARAPPGALVGRPLLVGSRRSPLRAERGGRGDGPAAARSRRRWRWRSTAGGTRNGDRTTSSSVSPTRRSAGRWRSRPTSSSSPCRPADGGSPTCSRTATSPPPTASSIPTPRWPSGCISRSSSPTRPSSGPCGRSCRAASATVKRSPTTPACRPQRAGNALRRHRLRRPDVPRVAAARRARASSTTSCARRSARPRRIRRRRARWR